MEMNGGLAVVLLVRLGWPTGGLGVSGRVPSAAVAVAVMWARVDGRDVIWDRYVGGGLWGGRRHSITTLPYSTYS